MSDQDSAVERAYLEEVGLQLDAHIGRIKHCLGQLDDDQAWWRPAEGMNSIANLVLHLRGNIDQRLGSTIGGRPDGRDRPREFAERGPIPVADLIQGLDAVGAEAHRVLDALKPGRLLEAREWPGAGQVYSGTVLTALSQTMLHLAGHTQEILAMTRMQLGDRYRYPNPAADPRATAS